jgi:hypothetical protein
LNGLLAISGSCRPARSTRAGGTTTLRTAVRSAGLARLRSLKRTVYSIQAGKNYRCVPALSTVLMSSSLQHIIFFIEQPLRPYLASLSIASPTRGVDLPSNRHGLTDTPAARIAAAQTRHMLSTDAKKPAIALNACSWNTRSTQCTGRFAMLSISGTNDVGNKRCRGRTPTGIDVAQCSHEKTLYDHCCCIRWCPEEDSNLHTFRHTDLNRARLPIPPPGHCCDPTSN